jgi:hypothetical protein
MKRKIFTDVWDLVQIGNSDDCWNWLGYKKKFGYGNMTVNKKQYSAHRITYALTYPNKITFEAPKNKSLKEFVSHKCDNPSCVNPNHLFLGNYDDNNKDAKLKGRSRAPQGANNKKAKLTQEQAEQVRLFHGHDWSYVEIGKMFNIHANNISRICKGIGYKESRV